MNKIKNYLLMIACTLFAASTMTSCLSSDSDTNSDYRAITSAEKTTCMLATQGSYSGKLHYYTNTNQTAKDSSIVKFSVSMDSTFVMEIPDSVFAGFVSDITYKKVLKESTQKHGFRGTTHLPQQLYVIYFNQGIYSFNLEQNDKMTFKVGEDDVTIKFASYVTIPYNTSSYVYPFCQYYQNMMQGYLCIKTVSVNGKDFDANTYMLFVGKKY